MDGSDRDDDRTFKVNFTSDGILMLRERVKEKLKDLMGDYTDDYLVEYVIILLKNGRRKEEAKKALGVFLGDDSDSFVNWLWDHLSSSLHLYIPSQETLLEEAVKTKPVPESNVSEPEQLSGRFHSDSEDEEDKSINESRRRRNREWKGLVRDVTDPPPLRSSDIDNLHAEKPHHRSIRVKQTHTSRHSIHVKLKPPDERNERKQVKRDVTSQHAIDAPCRLLQFAVRDAVGTSRSSSSRREPVLKRLRSVVSASSEDVLQDDRSKKMRSVAILPHAISTAIKAAAEAAEDVIKVRCSGNVFDRLGLSNTSEATNKSSVLRAPMLENDCEDFDQMPRAVESGFLQRVKCGEDFEGDMTTMDRGTVLTSDSVSVNDGYNDLGIIRRRVIDASQTASSGNKDDNSLMVQYSVAKDTDDAIRKSRIKELDMPTPSVANASRKIVNISVNVNTWKPPHYKAAREVTELDNQVAVPEREAGLSKPAVRQTKENNVVVAAKENEVVHADSRNDVRKTMPPATGSYSTVRPFEDADSRTIFVSNVHFAATKDSLSRHFNKFGEVLKVIIVTDAAMGQPKGSAYIEFMRKEAAEHALSLNGTSFMSRILKVVRRSSVHHEASPMLSWPCMPRASPFAARLARVPFPRAMPNTFRARLPIKSGARSLQWKRDAAAAPIAPAGENVGNLQSGVTSIGNNVPTLTGRNLTYVRTKLKQDGNVGTT